MHARAVNARISKRNKTQRGNFSTFNTVKFCFLCALGTKKNILNLEEYIVANNSLELAG
jgi:hypothetical protein